MKTETRVDVNDLEVRAEADGSTVVSGRVIPYNVWSSPIGGEFIEKFLPGSIRQLGNKDEVFAYVEHDGNRICGRRSSDTLVLRDSAEGMMFECKLPNTTYAMDLKENIRSKNIKGMSVGFRVKEKDQSWDWTKSIPERTIHACDVKEVTFTHNPAYGANGLSMRSDVISPADVLQIASMTKETVVIDDMLQYRFI